MDSVNGPSLYIITTVKAVALLFVAASAPLPNTDFHFAECRIDDTLYRIDTDLSSESESVVLVNTNNTSTQLTYTKRGGKSQ